MTRKPWRFFLLFVFWAGVEITAQDEVFSSIFVVPESDPMSAIVSHRVSSYAGEAGKLQKVKNVFTAASAEENGVLAQTEFYAGLEAPFLFEMDFSGAYTARTGFVKRSDFVDEESRIVKTVLYPESGPPVELGADEVESLGRYPPLRLSFFVDTYSHLVTRTDYFRVESLLFGGSACVTYRNASAVLSLEDRILLARWAALHNSPGLETYFSRKILVSEEGRLFWISMEDSLLPRLTKDLRMFIRSYYIGDCYNGPVFAVISMKELDQTD